MIDTISWTIDICDLCRKDDSVVKSRLIGIMENNEWVGGYSREKGNKVRAIYDQWYKELMRPCLMIWSDMEKILICEKHLNEAIAMKGKFIS